MSINQIRKNRAERRKIDRDKKKELRRIKYDNYEIIIDITNIHKAFKRTQSTVSWKGSMQLFEYDFYQKSLEIFNIINTMISNPLKFVTFDIYERGKLRKIQSVDVLNRVIQHVICDEIINPYIFKSLIYDNTASQSGKGITLTVNRVEKHLRDAYKYYGSNNFYVIKLDISKYFDSISHDNIIRLFKEYFNSKEIIHELTRIVNSFSGDYGIGLGSQLCQSIAIIYLNSIDHYIKEVLCIHGYIRYMDDSLIICDDIARCYDIIEEVSNLYSKLHMKLNHKKTIIYNMKYDKITFIKKKFLLTDTGKVIIYGNKNCGKVLRHKMNKLKELLYKNKIDEDYILNMIKSYIGSEKKYVSKRYMYNTIEYCASKIPKMEDSIILLKDYV